MCRSLSSGGITGGIMVLRLTIFTALRHYGIYVIYGITALRHLRFTAFNYGVELFYGICRKAVMP